jgi:hypothetical protein
MNAPVVERSCNPAVSPIAPINRGSVLGGADRCNAPSAYCTLRFEPHSSRRIRDGREETLLRVRLHMRDTRFREQGEGDDGDLPEVDSGEAADAGA